MLNTLEDLIPDFIEFYWFEWLLLSSFLYLILNVFLYSFCPTFEYREWSECFCFSRIWGSCWRLPTLFIISRLWACRVYRGSFGVLIILINIKHSLTFHFTTTCQVKRFWLFGVSQPYMTNRFIRVGKMASSILFRMQLRRGCCGGWWVLGKVFCSQGWHTKIIRWVFIFVEIKGTFPWVYFFGAVRAVISGAPDLTWVTRTAAVINFILHFDICLL